MTNSHCLQHKMTWFIFCTSLQEYHSFFTFTVTSSTQEYTYVKEVQLESAIANESGEFTLKEYFINASQR